MNASAAIARAAKLFVILLLFVVSNPTIASDKEADRAKVRKQSDLVLTRLYAAHPAARKVIAASRGYATFSRWGVAFGGVGGGLGKGLLVAKPSNGETFMRFVEGSAGLGLGIKKYDLIFVFQNDKARANFAAKGWEAGGQATMAAKSGASGKAIEGAASVSPGVWVYQITDKGLAAEVGIKGTKYYRDKALN